MLTKGNVEIGLKTRFGPDWPGVRCGALTKAGGSCQRPAVKQAGRCARHGGKSTGLSAFKIQPAVKLHHIQHCMTKS